jgi:polyphosphate glucokinase
MRDSPPVSAPGPTNGGATKPAETAEPAPRPARKGPFTLAIDIGGTGLKATVLDAGGVPIGATDRVLTPRPATPAAILEALSKLVVPLGAFDRVSAGFPGIVRDGVVKTAPNLDPSWNGVPLASRLARLMKRPARVLNDAGVQGLGVIQGVGVEMMLTLGTGLGCGLFYEGVYVPNLELGHHPFRKGKTYEDYLGHGGLARDGVEKWNRHIARALEQIDPIWNPDRIYLGGGNSKHVTIELPAHVRLASNTAGLLGGIALWDGREGIELSKAEKATKTAHPTAPAPSRSA